MNLLENSKMKIRGNLQQQLHSFFINPRRVSRRGLCECVAQTAESRSGDSAEVKLWNYNNPAETEIKFREVLKET